MFRKNSRCSENAFPNQKIESKHFYSKTTRQNSLTFIKQLFSARQLFFKNLFFPSRKGGRNYACNILHPIKWTHIASLLYVSDRCSVIIKIDLLPIFVPCLETYLNIWLHCNE